MSHAIQSDALTRRFGKVSAVEALDLRVEEGSITAFLGPNGAGKTTTIRLLLGLMKPTSGRCEVLGRPPGDPEALRQLGAMVESPSLYDHLTGRENLEITRLMRGAPPSETDRVLEVVGLLKDARRIVQNYSLGMRQRLALALALLGTPRLLIMDEPTNGLDPSGIQEMRELIRHVPDATGATVFLSSHMLAEVEQIASQVVVIHRGRLRYQGPMEDLGAQGVPLLQVRVDDLLRGQSILHGKGIVVTQDGPYLLAEAAESEAPRIASWLIQEGSSLFELTPRRKKLETRFLELLEEA